MNDDTAQMILVMVTVGSEAEGHKITKALIQEQLAACVSTFPIHSIYQWQGKIQTDQEWQLVIKTKREQFDAIEALVRSLHHYEVPEIIAIPVVAGSLPYLRWVNEHSRSHD